MVSKSSMLSGVSSTGNFKSLGWMTGSCVAKGAVSASMWRDWYDQGTCLWILKASSPKPVETFGTSYQESLISSLNYTLGRTSSAIQDRREVKIKPRGATHYSPTGAKTIEFTITDSSAYLLANTLKLQFKLVNESGVADQDLEMLGPAHAVPFSSLSVKMAGQQVELIENYGKSYVAMDQLLSLIHI